ncbi:Chaperone protein dnaK2 [Rosistilla carotiformis]|uniref:Chaperone protein dnaK2 n=1 Tax=Rosistilla carotiformis TaxID=2528017 RepID=A0A518JLP3_9BACT|nr:Hsp70 family protein [Rosistilla carotiformis]QDV66463.1 Chaperone protein dnaK2 [Rosistilla carotiformis]
MQKAAVGLDLGTTISVAAYVDSSGQPQIAAHDREQGLVPSAIFFGDHVIVGNDAVDLGYQDFESYAEGFKRDIGKPHYQKRVRLCEVPAEVLTGFLVERLVQNVQHEIGPLSEVVVTVPAYFDERQRSATQRAVALAGIKVLDIINEPTAAAIAAGYQHLREMSDQAVRKILVYDLGGGTFDVTLLEIEGRVFKTLATDGDIYLGGRDFDERIVDRIAQSFLNKHGVDPRCDPADLLRLNALAREAKHALSLHDSFVVSFQHAGLIDGFTLTREAFEQAVAPLIERTAMTCQSVLSDANCQWSDVDEVLLVGGSSRIPLVAARLRQETSQPVTLAEQPDVVVAQGAALYAAMRSEQRFLDSQSQFEVVNVNAHSLGIQGVDLATKQRVNQVIIPRNSPLPASSTQVFRTMEDGQKNVRVRLLEGESENPVYCSSLGQCVVHLDPSLPKGTEIRVCCSYDASGTITVTAQVPATKASAFVEMRREGFAELEPLEVWRTRLTIGENASAAEDESDAWIVDASLGPDSSIGDLLSRLDQIYAHIGGRAIESAVPTAAVSTQRLMRQSLAESRTLRRLVDMLNKKQALQTQPKERMQMQGHVARARMAWDQANKLYLHSCVGLGRTCLQHDRDGFIDDALSEQLEQLEQWIRERVTSG